jgi:zinc protease
VSAPLDRAAPPAPGPQRPFHFPPVHRHTLGNGLQVMVAEAHGLPVVTLELVIPGGGLAEPEERAGLASFTAGLLESGAGARTGAEVAEAVDALGLALETGVSWDAALAGITSLRTRMEPGFELLADLVRAPAFPRGEVDRIRDERLSGLSQRRADPGSLADELILRYVYADGVPYGRRLGGVAETLSTLTRSDAAEFHAERYRPAGACLCAAGDVTLDEVVALAERHLDGWEGAPPAVAVADAPPRHDATTLIVADRPGAVQSEVRVAHPGMARGADDFIAALVLNAVLGGSFASRLNLSLRERLGYTYGVHSQFSARRREGMFSISSAIQSEGTGHAVSEMLREMRELRAEPVGAEELDAARSYLAGTFPLGLQTTDGVASRLTMLAVHGFPDDYWDTYRERILAVTTADVQRTASARLHPDRAVILVVGDAAALRPQLEALDAGPVRVVDPAEVLR